MKPETLTAPGETAPGAASIPQDNPLSASDQIQTEAAARIGMVSSLNDLPAVRKYLLRIGAQEIHFWAAKVERDSRHGYPQVAVRVMFADDGTVTVNGDVEKPTKEEQDAICAAFKRVEFPELTTLTAIAEPPPGVCLTNLNTFVLHDLKGDVAMIHCRYDKSDGTKGFIPWTPWSNGVWRKMEPEVLPFYGVRDHHSKSTLFIHEGAKAARRVQRIVAGELPGEPFPWLEQVRHGHHVGWIGGVHAIDRSDWAGLAKLGWHQVIVFTDNDAGGIEAAAEIPRHFRCPAYLVRWDGHFPDRFDCGDPWPADQFDVTGRYVGPSLRDCLQPFDRATNLVPVTTDSGSVKMVPSLRDEFIARYRVVAETQQVFCVERPAMAMEKKAFNDDVRSRSDTKDTYALLIEQESATCASRVYRPDKKPGRLIDKGWVVWNAFEPSDIVPQAGDIGPFIAYLEHLFPVPEERHHAMRWIATLIVRRDIRMHHSMLLVSHNQGVGKSTLGQILAALLGETNVSFPGQNAFDSQFNSWADGKLLVHVDEVYTNGKPKTYDTLKNYVTDDKIEINLKNVKQFTIQNWSVILACSNSRKALFLPDEDRRWFVPTVTESLQDRAWWEALHAWLAGSGHGIIRAWAETIASDNPVLKGERPPITAAKRAIVAENKSEGRLLARDFAEEFAAMDAAIVRVSELRAWVAAKRGVDLGHANLEKERLLIEELETVDGLTVWKGDARPKVGGRRGEKASVVFNFPLEPGTTWGQVEDRLKSMKELGFDAAM